LQQHPGEKMGSILINVPDIDDTHLIYNEPETRQILKFFWPDQAGQINALEINNDNRRLAQTALIAAIDGSCPMNYLAATFKAAFFPLSRDIKSLARKLAYHYVKNWWKNSIKRSDLGDVQIYDSIRNSIAFHLKDRLITNTSGAAIKRSPVIFIAYIGLHSTVLS
jgi:hypothetical protein